MPSGDKTTAAALLDIGRTAAYELSPKGAMAEPGLSWQFVRIPTGPLLELLQLRRNRQIAPPGAPRRPTTGPCGAAHEPCDPHRPLRRTCARDGEPAGHPHIGGPGMASGVAWIAVGTIWCFIEPGGQFACGAGGNDTSLTGWTCVPLASQYDSPPPGPPLMA